MIEQSSLKSQICNEKFAAKQDLIIHSASIHNGTKSLKTFNHPGRGGWFIEAPERGGLVY